MINSEIAEIFYRMADILEMKQIEWKPIAYRNAARSIESLSKDLKEIHEKEGLKGLNNIPAVGKHLAEKIEEYIKTKKIGAYEKMKKKFPVKVEELMRVEGMGPKTIMLLYKKLKIKNLRDLEKAAKAGKISKLPRMGEKTEENMLKSIAFAKSSGERKPLGFALPVAEEIIEKLKKQSYINKVSIAGSAARKVETVGDIDILITTKNPKKTMDFFTKLPNVKRVIAKGPTKSTVIYNNIEVDARVVKPDQFGSALQYFIGSKSHNVALRKIAIKKGYKLSEYGLFKGKKAVAGKDEKGIYKKLGMRWIPPELRENTGEIEAAQENKLPKLVQLKDIKCDTQMHTRWSDGKNTIEEMAKQCRSRGYKYCCITDHVGQLAVAGAMSKKDIIKQKEIIKKLNSKLKGFRVLHGAEVDIKLNGDLAADKSMLKQFDWVLAAIHQGLKRNKEQQTKRVIDAIENKYVNAVAHPTGRLINQRPGYNLNFKKVFKAAKENNVTLEINAYPTRLDLNDVNARAEKDYGLNISIGTDAHHIDQLRYMELGVAVARRAWCEKKNILNTLSLKKFLKKISR